LEARRVIYRKVDDGRYIFTDADHGLEFHVDRLRRERGGELVGELSVACGILGARVVDGILSSGSFNFSSVPTRAQRAKLLGERARTNGKVDWLERLEEVCQRVTLEDRAGDPGVVLADVPRPAAEDVEDYDVLGFRLPQRHGTIAFGDGGAGKSEPAMKVAIELERAGIHVGYFDWELDAPDQRPRLERQSAGQPLPRLRYVRCDKPLVYEIDRLRRIVQDDGIRYVVLDSAGYGCHGPAEDSNTAMEFFRAYRQLRVGGLILAHTTKSGEHSDQRPFGSTFWHNSARSTWFVKRDTSGDDGSATIGLFNRKNNLGRPYRPVGIRVTYDQDQTHFDGADLADVPDLAAGLSLKQRIRALLKAGPQTLATIANELEHSKVDSIDRIVRREKDTFTKVSGKDGITRIALVERRAS
jgi:hypothetical protein